MSHGKADLFALARGYMSGRLATHHDGRAYDRIMVSDAIANGLAGLQFAEVIIGRHRRLAA